ncbi:MAG: hypothetical protein R3C52_15550, partial [Hyphomonadaceae bacterium]
MSAKTDQAAGGEPAKAGFRPVSGRMIGWIAAGGLLGLAALMLIFAGFAMFQPLDGTPAPSVSAPAETPETPETPEAPAGNPAAAAPAGPPPPPGQIGEAFVDRFDGPELDPRWNVSDGWSNGAWIDSDWRKEQVRLTPAGLEI